MSERQEYIDKLTEKLQRWDKEIAALDGKITTVSDDVKAEYQARLKELLEHKAVAQKKLREVRDSSEEAWQELQKGLEKSWDTLAQSFRDAANKFK